MHATSFSSMSTAAKTHVYLFLFYFDIIFEYFLISYSFSSRLRWIFPSSFHNCSSTSSSTTFVKDRERPDVRFVIPFVVSIGAGSMFKYIKY